MRIVTRAGPVILILTCMAAAGCDSADERLARMAQDSIETQKQQNAMLARQSEAVIVEGQHLTQAARDLVAQDAAARAELIGTVDSINRGFQTERAALDRHRQQIDQERTELERLRHRDPIVASAIQWLGMLLVCLVPLAIAAYALAQLSPIGTESDEVAEILLGDLLSEHPRFLDDTSNRRLAGPEEPEDIPFGDEDTDDLEATSFPF